MKDPLTPQPPSLETSTSQGRGSLSCSPLPFREGGRQSRGDRALLGGHNPNLEPAAHRLRQEMTPAEQILWQALRGSRIAGWHFRRQHVIGQVIVDFYCHRAGLVVEVDGPVHLAQQEQDAQRDLYLAGRGLRVLRILNAEIEADLPAVLARIAAACGEKA